MSAENLAAIATFRQSKARHRQEIIVFCFAAHMAPNLGLAKVLNSMGLRASFSQRRLRMLSGLVMFAFITIHLFNHALGLVSLALAE
ncbi:MAG: hypothetical protein WBE93_28300, partial [Pseudolabrys sp.]